MDILDNIMFAAFNRPAGAFPKVFDNGNPYMVNPTVWPLDPLVTSTSNTTPPVETYNFQLADKLQFCSIDDAGIIDRATTMHWYNIDKKDVYQLGGHQVSSFAFSSTYHLIYAYLIENTRILQIFERVIERYVNDEDLGITNNATVFNWIANSEQLFFDSDRPRISNLRSIIRPNSDASRRNAYYRMFGMDLAFGDIDSQANSALNYVKAKSSNQQFVLLFERFLAEIWQGYINARNTSGANTSDVNIIVELAQQLQEMLAARRGDPGSTDYGHRNLSREEFSSVMMTSWFTFIISFDSDIVNYLSCQSSTIGERLMKIGNKVGIPAHKKCQSLFEMAAAAANTLLAVEAGGLFTDPAWVQKLLSSLNPDVTITPPIQANFMNDLLTVINNWEKATGHTIKSASSAITGSLQLQPPTGRPKISPASLPANGKPPVSAN